MLTSMHQSGCGMAMESPAFADGQQNDGPPGSRPFQISTGVSPSPHIHGTSQPHFSFNIIPAELVHVSIRGTLKPEPESADWVRAVTVRAHLVCLGKLSPE